MRAHLLVAAAALAAAGEARAVTLVVKNLDPPGQGFNDATPAAPVGGNPGTTVGQQRTNVFNRAAELWGAGLVGTVPIEIDANFAPLPCTGGFAVLGHARATSFMANSFGAPGDVWLPVALINELAGFDQAPGDSEIEATFNGGLAACTNGKQDWYYGFDGKSGDHSDLLSVVLHELGHGLGFTSVLDLDTGETQSGRFNPFAAHVFDTALGQPWTALTNLQRVTSVRTPRSVVFDGPNVTRQAAQLLALGAPVMKTTPALPGLGARVAEAEFGPALAVHAASGPLAVGTLSPATCEFVGSAAGAVVLITQTICAPIQQAFNAQQAGAVAVLLKERGAQDPPITVDVQASHRLLFPVTVPVLAVSSVDATVLAAAPSGTMVQLSAEAATRVGADMNGRPMLYATNPIVPSSTLSHWEMFERPNLLMEPVQAPDAIHDLRMELALFRDIGWSTTCGNGVMDSGEACDQGAQNGAPGASCRADCTLGSGGGTGGAGGTDAGSGGQGGGLPPDAAPMLSADAAPMLPADAAPMLAADAAPVPADARAADALATGGTGGTVPADAAAADLAGTGGMIATGFLGGDGAVRPVMPDELVGGCACDVGTRPRGAPWGLSLVALVLVARRRRR